MRQWKRSPRQPRSTLRCWVDSPSRSTDSRCRIAGGCARPRRWRSCSHERQGTHCNCHAEEFDRPCGPMLSWKRQPTTCIRSCSPSGTCWAQRRSPSTRMWYSSARSATSPWMLINSGKPPPPPAAAAKSPRCDKRSIPRTGPLLPEDLYADWADQHREQLTETQAAVAALLGSKLIEQGVPAAALTVLEPLAAERPLDEHVHRVLIDALAELGRRWEAIETYERLRDALDEAYAAEPEPQTKAIHRRLLTGGKPMRATTLHNLPESTTSFVGRTTLARRAVGKPGAYASAHAHWGGRRRKEPARLGAGPAGGQPATTFRTGSG